MARSRTFKAAMLASGTLLTSLVGLGSAMVLSRLLSKADFGTYQQTLLSYNLAAPLLAMGLPLALYYFLPRNRDRMRGTLVENLLLLGVCGLAFMLFMFLGGNRLLASRAGEPNPTLERTLLIFAPYALFMLPAMAVSAVLVSTDHYRRLAMYNWMSRLAMLALAIGACLIWRSPSGAVAGQVVGAAAVFLPAMLLMWRSCPEGPSAPTWRGMREQIVYSFPLGLMRGFGALRSQLDKLIVAAMFGAEAYAVYAVGAVELPLVGVLSTSITGVLLPEATRLTQEDRKAEALALWRRAAVKSALLVFPMTVFFVAMAPETMRVLFTKEYEGSAAPFRVYTLQLPLRIVNVGNLFLSAGKGKLLLWINVASLLVNAVLSFTLVSSLGPVGAAWGGLLSLVLCLFPLSLGWIGKHYGSRVGTVLPFATLSRTAGVAVFAGAVFLAKPYVGGIHDIPLLCLSATAYAVVVALLYDRFGILSARDLLTGLRNHWYVRQDGSPARSASPEGRSE